MSSKYRHLSALAAVCISILAVVIAIRIVFPRAPSSATLNENDGMGAERTRYSVEPSFFGTAASSSDQESDNSGRLPAKITTIHEGPMVTAAAYLVGDVSTGKIYLEKNASTVLPVASMSKLVTAIAVTDIYSTTTVVSVTELETEVASDTSQLIAGEKFTVEELLYPLLLNSSNVAAEALASSTDRNKFLELMSSYAWEIGMPSTFFADPSGINPRNISSARDFFALARYLYGNRPDILAITRMSRLTTATTTEHNAHSFDNIHPFVSNQDFLGGKTGHTIQAGDTMLTIMNIAGRPIAVIVLGSKTGSRAGDTQILLDEFKKLY